MAQVRQLYREIDDPGDFLDWLMELGWPMESAAMLIVESRSTVTQQLLGHWETTRGDAA